MSALLTVGKRYAKALFELAREREEIDKVEAELGALHVLLEGEARDFFGHPSIGIELKLDVLNKALEGKVSETLLGTLRLMLERRRHEAIEAMTAQYVRLANDARGRATAIVYTPKPLTETEQQQVAAHFGKLTGKQIKIENEIRPELLGGLQVRIGDRLYDGSLSGKLNGLKKLLA